VYIDFKIDRLYMYTAETFRQFSLKYDNGIANIAWYMDSKNFFKETRYLIINCASISLPKFPKETGFRNLNMLVMHGQKRGDRWPNRGWTYVRQQEIKDNYRPEGDMSATEFDIMILREPVWEDRYDDDSYLQYFANMVTAHLSPDLIFSDRDRQNRGIS
jgi:hypothetical protein